MVVDLPPSRRAMRQARTLGQRKACARQVGTARPAIAHTASRTCRFYCALCADDGPWRTPRALQQPPPRPAISADPIDRRAPPVRSDRPQISATFVAKKNFHPPLYVRGQGHTRTSCSFLRHFPLSNRGGSRQREMDANSDHPGRGRAPPTKGRAAATKEEDVTRPRHTGMGAGSKSGGRRPSRTGRTAFPHRAPTATNCTSSLRRPPKNAGRSGNPAMIKTRRGASSRSSHLRTKTPQAAEPVAVTWTRRPVGVGARRRTRTSRARQWTGTRGR